MKLIAAVDENWGIGYNNQLLAHIPEDMKRFKFLTTGNGSNAVVMGRKTFESIGKLLPNRINIILASSGISYIPTQKEKDDEIEYFCAGVIEDIFRYIKFLGLENKTYIIGGASIYKQFIEYCDGIYITKIHKKFDDVDTYFPVNLDKNENFSLIDQTITYSHNGLHYSFCDYINLKHKRIGE